MKWLRRFLLITAATLCMGFQESDEESRLPGQPDTCNNSVFTLHKCHCSRASMACSRPGEKANPDQGPNKCLTTCRPKACGCHGPGCTSRR